jgi:hypothetical protein
MTDAEAALLARARRAYERGRALLGLRIATVVVPMAVVSWTACGNGAATLLGSVALTALVVAAVWHGRDAGRGARIGLAAGVLPLLLPVLVAFTGHLCDTSVCMLFPAACLGGGVAGGVVLGLLATRAGLGPSGLASAGLAAWLCGSLGCLVAGSVGITVLLAGLAFGLAPVLSLRRA